MRILLGANALYYPAHGGGERSNRMVMEGLAERGHTCFVVTRIDRFGLEGEQRLKASLASRGIAAQNEPGSLGYRLNGVEVLTATTAPGFRAFFAEHKTLFRPDVILTSTDDPAQVLLEAALHDEHATTVFLTRATIALPFGPDAAFPSREKTEMLQHADALVGVSNYVARYIREHSGINAVHVPIAPAEPGPYAKVGSFNSEFVTMVNPCAVKGIKIFLELAQALPHIRFAGVPTWGTTPENIEALRSAPNVTVLEKVDNVNEILRRTRVLLVPSVWAEARSRIVVEAMLAGVPVIASNLGGLPEAKMGVPYILPVTPLHAYGSQLDEQFVPVAEVPDQKIGPWIEALERLTQDPAHWQEISEQSRSAAIHYAETATVDALAAFLADLKRKPRAFVSRRVEMPSDQLARLSPERRKLLELKLRSRTSIAVPNPALPMGGTDTTRFRLFCFPHAGGGAGFFRSWRAMLEGIAGLAPVQYPGHETWRAENFAASMEELIQALFKELRQALNGGFAFFGHSMGAIVAFELMRTLRREGLPLPAALIASAARAPQFRLNHVPPPDPSRKELLEQVRRLDGLPEDVLASSDAVELLLPALEADTALYRRYVYEPGPPFDVPILAVGGTDDVNVTEAHRSAWKEQTLSGFEAVQLEGGHFYFHSNQAEFQDTLRRFVNAYRPKPTAD